ncbi:MULTISPECIES: flagellar basal-body MS-ring/collar protein FliF [Alteromonadaceae]|uniref:Flagellar M-ring protein n=1 Tax=Brumicola blandensis TaxID=3075611 RepID=A0AAW8R0L1_9ALTE|nr:MULTISPECIES: flagellar basal-body MS-ring/collar protein FliF [unclassified Alteromonas]MDT0582836.1 flagellar basal-body MS-ring/collar protein FliF [Alteromonas sp. W409]MDT0628252.1 flagellar basal-body MS-ring/collar protein FliF [Alteromonas sp. W364]
MAEAASTELALSDNLDNGDDAVESKPSLVDQLGTTEMVRQITLVVTLVICIAIAFFVFLWSKEPTYRPLAQMPTQELIETLDYLDQNEIQYKLEGNTVYVVESQFKDVKFGMARNGISNEASQGTDIIMQDMGFGVSQRVEMERLKHAREQQIARTIEDMNGIGRARVLLALPKENVFARREKKASATVVVTARRGNVISGEEVDSIVDIVASAVQGMEPSRVTVTDNNGRLLNSGSQDAGASAARKEYELEKKRESEYMEKIDSILIPVLGLGNYTAQADVTMDFTATEQTQRRYNPDLPAVRSEMISEQNNVGNVIAGIPGALSNQPPLDANIPENAGGGANGAPVPGSNSKESTRNYELDTTISHTKKQSGVIRRLSVSVAVDYTSATAEDGTVSMTPKSQEELLNIRRLLQGGIGFDVTRGDSLEVVSIPFNRIDLGAIEEKPLWEQERFMPILKLVLGALVIIVLIFFVVRPMLMKLIFPENNIADDEFDESDLDLGDDPIAMLSDEFDETQVGFAADGSLMLPNLRKDEDVLKAVRALVANEPELSAQVVRGWLLQDE